ncbi:MAG: hypothetical protein I3273_03275 [Candidatus Moeniiplasma glomeromycotorum]|nr:hypothetical protein [Candidatus Moeniiplasma glomeromycotorum]MCE8167723.1 hypothetical protein [Candidatus Moeniiplasma glomeromycotorum]MCE8169123.1 hypothetical protein [Candidatus Moeniiplasma glomeromycotorum]
MNQNNKKILAEKLKAKLNSPEYVAMPDLISRGEWCPDMLVWFPQKKEGWVSVYEDVNLGGKRSDNIILHSELEENNWEEITNLIEKQNQKRRRIWEEKEKNIQTKLNSQANLYYHWGSNVKYKGDIGSIEWKGMREYLQLEGGKDDLFIAENHPILNNFSFEVGFYSVDTNKQIESSPHSGRPDKFVEVGDQITITPYQVKNNNELSEKTKSELKEIKDCDICQKNKNEMDNGTEKWYVLRRYHGQKNEILGACSNCYKNKEQEYLQNYESIFAHPVKDLTHEGVPFDIENIKGGKIDCYAGHKDQNGKILQQQNCPHCQPWKNHETDKKNGKLSGKAEKEIIEWLIQYFQANNIKHISLKNGELTITNNNNNNKVMTSEQVNNDAELKNVQNWLQVKGIQDLDRQDLNISNSQTPSNSQKPQKTDYTPYLLTGAIGIGLVSLVVVSYYLGKKRSKKNNY